MSLPKIKYPIYDTEIPSSKKRVKYRPMTVKEEKVLLVARESEEQSQIVTALAQVVNNCLLEKGIDVTKLAIFDVEFLFLQIRMHSVSDVSKVSFRDTEDEETRDFDIDLTKVAVKFPEIYNEMTSQPLDVNGVLLTLYSPTVEDFGRLDLNDTSPEGSYRVVASCIDSVDGEDFSKYSAEEQLEFIEQIPSKEFDKIKTFFDNIPRLHHVIKYTNKNGKERTIVLDSLVDFFTV